MAFLLWAGIQLWRQAMKHSILLLAIPITLACIQNACVRPAEDRSDDDTEVGQAELPGLSVEVAEGLAAIRSLAPDEIVLWAQAPTLALEVQSDTAQSIRLEVRNCMPDAVVTMDATTIAPTEKPRTTWCVFTIPIRPGQNSIAIAPPDAENLSRYKFADMGDIQTAMDTVDEVFDAISAYPDLRFVMSTGDVVEKGENSEYELFEEQLNHLNIPFFSTVGNHELTQDIGRWHERYGRYSIHFSFKGVDFSYVDSGNAGLDPSLYARLDTWLDHGRDRIHIFGTHYPLKDPVGVRNASFRSRNEATRLLVKLAEAAVDLTFYGHVHSYYKFENAGIPAYISGGGGAHQEVFDGIDRHFMVVDVDPVANEVRSVEVSHVPK